MRVICPACQAAYEVPDQKLVAGKRLRCARCANEWQPPAAVAPAAEIVAAAPVVVAPFQLDRPARVGSERKPPNPVHTGSSAGLWVAWLLTFVVLGAGTWAAYAYRGQIMQAWPPSQRAYAAVGLQ